MADNNKRACDDDAEIEDERASTPKKAKTSTKKVEADETLTMFEALPLYRDHLQRLAELTPEHDTELYDIIINHFQQIDRFCVTPIGFLEYYGKCKPRAKTFRGAVKATQNVLNHVIPARLRTSRPFVNSPILGM